jgi:hypothetical protein
MTLNKQQEIFVSEAMEKLNLTGFWTLNGPAGTGKTLCIGELFKRFRNIVFLAPTHKAKQVLQSKLGPDAYIVTTTSFTKGFRGTKIERIDSQIEYAMNSQNEELLQDLQKKKKLLISSGEAQQPVFFERDREEDGEKHIAVVVDESSMVSSSERDAILRNADSVIFVGDSYQLPPVDYDTDADWFGRIKHTWQLTEVVRQGKESGILHLATLIRTSNANGAFPLRKWMIENEDNFEDLYVLQEDKDCLFAATEPDSVMLSFTNIIVDDFCYDARRVLGLDQMVATPDDSMYAGNNFGDFKNKDDLRLTG